MISIYYVYIYIYISTRTFRYIYAITIANRRQHWDTGNLTSQAVGGEFYQWLPDFPFPTYAA